MVTPMPLQRTTVALFALALVGAVTHESPASAGPSDATGVDAEPAAGGWASKSLLQHFGTEGARRLLQASGGTRAELLRGVERARALGSQEGVVLLLSALQDRRGAARTDGQVLLAATRALAPYARQKSVARALADAALLAPSSPPLPPVRPGATGAMADAATLPEDIDRGGRFELARDTAALALARAGTEDAVSLLLLAVKQATPGAAAAARALTAFLPRVPPSLTGGASLGAGIGAEVTLLLASLGDRRAADAVLDVAKAGAASLRAAALLSEASLRDARALPVAEAAIDDVDPGVRVAAATVLIAFGAPEAARALRKLIENAETASRGALLSARVAGDEVTGALAACARAAPSIETRRDALAALAKRAEPHALEAIVAFESEPAVAADALEAAARSVASGAWSHIESQLAEPASRRSAARMAAVRARALTEAHTMPEAVRRRLRELAVAPEPVDRSAGLVALVLAGEEGPTRGLADPEPAVRRAVAMACDLTNAVHARALADRLAVERDPVTARLLRRAWVLDAATDVGAPRLRDLVLASGTDAPVAALALARRDESDPEFLASLLASPDPLIRAHVARGLGGSKAPWAVGLLARAYVLEVDLGVRRAIVLALAERVGDIDLAVRADALALASELDPDAPLRTLAQRARDGLPPPERPRERDTALLHATTPSHLPPTPSIEGLLVRADGLAVPVLFDDDGYALVSAPRGPARVVLAPRPSAYDSLAHDD